MELIERFTRALASTCLKIAEAGVVVMLAIMSVLVVTRYVFSYSMPWAEEATRYLLVWSTLLAATYLLREEDHIRVDFFVEYLPEPVRRVIDIVVHLLILAFLATLFVQSIRVIRSISITYSPALDISMGWPYLALPIAAFIMALFTIELLFKAVRRLFAGR